MKVHQRVAVTHDLGEETVGNTRGHTAPGISGEIAIQVTPVRQVAGVATEAQQINDGDADDHAVQFVWVNVVHDPPDHLDPVELVTVNRGGEAQGGSVTGSVYHENRGVHRHPAGAVGGFPYKPGGSGGRNVHVHNPPCGIGVPEYLVGTQQEAHWLPAGLLVGD